MKKIIIFFIISLSISMLLNADDYENFNFGLSIAGGGRYDPVRMCIASPAGFPGGPAFEFLGLVCEYRFNKIIGVGAYIPVGRPILFAAAFHMLQFLPEFFVLSIHIPVYKIFEFVFNIAHGISLHYGPDYRSDINNRGPSFFAAGPRFSILFGAHITIKNRFILIIGAKPYFEYLVSRYIQGPVAGGELDIQFRFSFKTGKK